MLQKRYIILATLGLGVVTFSSCGKKFLEKKPISTVNETNFYQSDEDLKAAVTAAYDPLNWQTDNTTSVYCPDYVYGDVASDDSRKGSSEADLADFTAFDKFYVNSGSPQLRFTYRHLYRGVYLANLVIEKVPKASAASQRVKNMTLGEAYFLRAFYHFKLTNLFGEIPLVNKVLEASEYEIGNSSKAAIMKQIEDDLNQAISLLASTPLDGQSGRATKGAARGLLMRVYLFQKKWDSIKQTFEAFEGENNGMYALEANFKGMFTLPTINASTKESVFAIQAANLDNGDNDNFGRQHEGLLNSTMCAPRNNAKGEGYGGWGFNRPTLDLVNAFKVEKTTDDKMDPRYYATIVGNGDTIGSKLIEIDATDSTQYPFTRYFNRKYVIPYQMYQNAAIVAQWLQVPMNFMVIRYADILLMASEAYNELGDNANALKYLNMVRSRSNLAAKTTTDQNALRGQIWDERRLEFAMEGLRFFDLVRQGRAAEVIQKTGDSHFSEGQAFVKGVNEVFPIPQDQIDLSNGKLLQNKGY